MNRHSCPSPYRWRFRAARVALGLLLVAALTSAGVLWTGQPGQVKPKAQARPSYCPPLPTGTDIPSAARVAGYFVATAVLRHKVACSYDLVSAKLRQGVTRERWATGNIPVQPYFTTRPDTFEYLIAPQNEKTLVVTTRQGQQEIPTWVRLGAADTGPVFYMLVLVKEQGRWLVDSWGSLPANDGA